MHALRGGDIAAAAREVNHVLAQSETTVRLRRDFYNGRWLVVPAGTPAEAASAAFGLTQRIAVDGWRRVKFCSMHDCSTFFVDRTNGNIRRYCARHTTYREPSGGQSEGGQP
ncbi:CGNR zinc finger domain-containing protein [Antrihabitans sp. NCIMB 15449]|uniref:CGNR zinc finger domain-containing protein n=1 Tax=Antrihabitans spumae TaxID=3373370 RepID=A0ABW7JKM6_9NOCA